MSERDELNVFPWPKTAEALDGRFRFRRREGVRLSGVKSDGIALFGDELHARCGIRLAPSPSGRVAIARNARLPAEGYELKVTSRGVALACKDNRGLLYGLDTLASLIERDGDGAGVPACRVEDAPYTPVRGVHVYMPARESMDFFNRFLRFMVRLRMNTLFLEIGAGMEFKRHPEINASWEHFTRTFGKYNEEVGPKVQQQYGWWKDSTHPEIAGGSFLKQSEVKELVREAGRLGIEIVPEVQSLSHSYWLCLAHPELAERVEDPYPDTYCPSNPKSYALLFDAIDEVLAVFEPRMVHIGHDEWYTIGLCPKCRKKSGAELLATDVKKISRHLARRGVKTCMWGDKILNFVGDDGKRYGGARREIVNPRTGNREVMRPCSDAIKTLPRDVEICHWYYKRSDKGDKALVRHGLRFFYGNFNPYWTSNWAERSRQKGFTGGEISTWIEMSEPVFGLSDTFVPIALTANMLWSHRAGETSPIPADTELPEGMPVGALRGQHRTPAYRAVSATVPSLRRYLAGPALPSERMEAEFRPLSLGRAATLRLKGRLNGAGYNLDWVARDTGDIQLRTLGVPFRRGPGGRVVGLALGSADQAVLPVEGKAGSLVFVHTLVANPEDLRAGGHRNQRPEAHTVAVYRVVYAGNRFVEIPVLTGHTIGLLDQPYGAGPHAEPFPAAPALTDGRRTVYAYEWLNPYPDRTIERLYLESTAAKRNVWASPVVMEGAPGGKGGVIVLGVTAVGRGTRE
ncbi:MAG: family 20 glycosylhydrolase [Kiritimatiellae bacterium]|nr:family 20 glycosylhydrolase [Kiritimatiellia bacterium]